jgi:transposase-like protein
MSGLATWHPARGFHHERPPRPPPELAHHILDQLSRGRSLRAICRDDGIPSLNTVLKWVRDDRDGFAARYREALRLGNAPRGRPSLYTDEIADRIMGELLEGRRLSDICADPDMPSAAAVRVWVMEDRNGFAALYRRAKDAGEVATGRRTLYTPELADLILDELSRGRTLRDVCRDPGIPSDNTVRLWVIEDREDFAAHYALAREEGDYAMGYKTLDIVDNRRHDWIPVLKPSGETEMILDPDRVRRAELRAQARFSLLSKGMRRKYGARGF